MNLASFGSGRRSRSHVVANGVPISRDDIVSEGLGAETPAGQMSVASLLVHD